MSKTGKTGKNGARGTGNRSAIASLTRSVTIDPASDDESHPLTEQRFMVLLNESLTALRNDISSDMKNLFKEIEELKNENVTLRNEIVNICLRDEQREIAENSQNLIINGIQDESDSKGKIISALNFVLSESNSPLSSEDVVKEIHPIGKPSAGPSKDRTFKIKCLDKASRDTILKNAKCLRNYDQNKQVYINADLPPLTRRENTRLRTKL